MEIDQPDLDAKGRADRENKERLVKNNLNPTEGLIVNDQITLQDIILPEPNIVSPLQLPPNVSAIADEITNNLLTKISQITLTDLPESRTTVIDTDIDQGSNSETINYLQDDYICKILPEMLGEQQEIPQELLESLTRIGSIPSSPPQGDKLLPEINQVNKHETIIMNGDSDIDFNISRTKNEVGILNNNDCNSKVCFAKQNAATYKR